MARSASFPTGRFVDAASSAVTKFRRVRRDWWAFGPGGPRCQVCAGFGMSLADVSLFWGDVGTTHDRSDLNGDGGDSLADVSYAWAALSHPFD